MIHHKKTLNRILYSFGKMSEPKFRLPKRIYVFYKIMINKKKYKHFFNIKKPVGSLYNIHDYTKSIISGEISKPTGETYYRHNLD